MTFNFQDFSDTDLQEWIRQYADSQAGYYPGLRRTRARAVAEAQRRGLPYQHRAPRWVTHPERNMVVARRLENQK